MRLLFLTIRSYLKRPVGRLPGIVWVAVLLLVISSCGEVKKTKEIKLAHSLDVSHPVHKALVYMAERVLEKSKGEMLIEIYPSGQLGSERESLELLQIGSLGMTKISAATMENFSPKYKVFGMPYIFRDKAHFFSVLDGEVGTELLKEAEEYWLRGLGYYDAGSRSFYTTGKPIEKPADLQGLKIRVMDSNIAISMVQAFGGAATPISWGELYTALQQGVVDGAENNFPSFYLSRHYEVAKHFTVNEHTMIPDVLLISTKVWEELTEQQQQWLQEAANESVVVQRSLWVEAEEEALRAVKRAGVEIIQADKEAFARQVEPLYESFRDEPQIYSLLQRIRKAEMNPKESQSLN